jgi:hypothetical protein
MHPHDICAVTEPLLVKTDTLKTAGAVFAGQGTTARGAALGPRRDER